MNKLMLKLKKNSPEILMGVGIVAIIAGTVKACKDTPKAVQIVEEANKTLDTIHTVQKTTQDDDYTEKDFRRDIALTYIQTSGRLIKTYAPAAILIGTGIGCVLGSHRILSKRNAALTAAYTLVDQGYSEYRKKVIEKFGEEADKQIRYGLSEEEVETKYVDDKGKEKTKKEKKTIVNDIYASPYAKFFDASSRNYEKDPELNLTFLKIAEREMNERLKYNKIVFLNEVYDYLDIPRTTAGQVVGWVYDPEVTNKIDFGIFSDANRGAVNGYEPAFILNFNVDGDVLSHL